MTLVKEVTKQLQTHVDELENIDLITENEAGRLRDRINALEGDMEAMYDRTPLDEAVEETDEVYL